MQTEFKTTTLPVGCFAPPLSDELIAGYETLVNALPDERGDVRDAMRECLTAVKFWWTLPESKGTPKDGKLLIVHREKEAIVRLTTLTPDLVKQLWDVVPWPYEIDAMKSLFNKLPSGTREYTGTKPIDEKVAETGTFLDWNVEIVDEAAYKLCNAAFHLLWHVNELSLDREPLTQDKLPDDVR